MTPTLQQIEAGLTDHLVWRNWWDYGSGRTHASSMIGKKNIGRSTGVTVATVYATLITGTIYGFWHSLHTASVLLIFIVLWIGIYFAGVWVAVDRPAELDRKFPISGRELRKRKKAFYDWLASQRRR
jgi:hypothetical protein